MKEHIAIQYNTFADPARVAAFRDTLTELLKEKNSNATVSCTKVPPFHLRGQQFRVTWEGSCKFESPDGKYKFEYDHPIVVVETCDLTFNTYEKLIGGRSQMLAMAYHKALNDILAMTVELGNNNHLTDSEVSASEYIRETLQAALQTLLKYY
jgi:hypothetical protein